jgi:hypothetical protein
MISVFLGSNYKIMNTLRLFLISLTAAFIAASCTFRQEITFNNDMGGEYAFQIEMGEYLEFMKSMSAMGGEDFDFKTFEDSLKLQMGDIAASFADVGGIDGAESFYDADKSAIVVKYGFKNLDALNQTNGASLLGGDMPQNAPAQFILGENSLTYKMGSDALGQLTGGQEPGMTEMFGSMMNFAVRLNFSHNIKSVSNKKFTILENKKSVEGIFSLDELLSSKEGMNVTVNW